MKIKSNLRHNISYYKTATAKSSAPDYMTIPAGATLELDDDMWFDAFANVDALLSGVASGTLEIVAQPVSPLIEDQVGITVGKKEKAELQTLALKLGVDLSAPVPKTKKKKLDEA